MVKEMWTAPELTPPLLTTTPHQREDASALDRFNVHPLTTTLMAGLQYWARTPAKASTTDILATRYHGHFQDGRRC
ncbi:hypothetical protein TNCV_4590821 [Trichonephila clavipes]|nr:hypothetical protein TNCV_4590821 [Trichonephila clavipes]